ncbi:MAG: hypothetical protein JWO88_3735 [Frankiales bacterium]|nr:hypothetical protein [Frankiales bacterium]
MSGDEERNHWSMQLNAALDGELDAAGMLAFEQRLAEDRALAAEYDSLLALRRVMRRQISEQRAPDDLRARMAALVADPQQADTGLKAAQPRKAWTIRPSLFAAGLAVSLLVGGLARDFIPALSPRSNSLALAIVDGHRRALISANGIDVRTSDKHSIKPWFDERLAMSPRVADPAPFGATVRGARVDVIAGTPVPTVVYQLRAHAISVTTLPAQLVRAAGRLPSTIDGYTMTSWRDGDLVDIAVADIPPEELAGFTAGLRENAASEDRLTPRAP